MPQNLKYDVQKIESAVCRRLIPPFYLPPEKACKFHRPRWKREPVLAAYCKGAEHKETQIEMWCAGCAPVSWFRSGVRCEGYRVLEENILALRLWPEAWQYAAQIQSSTRTTRHQLAERSPIRAPSQSR